MKYLSTKGEAPATTLSQAISLGLASDGGLFVPESFPAFTNTDFARVESLAEVAQILLAPFFADDPLATRLPLICQDAFNFPVPLRPIASKDGLSVLELFHGPTAAFKDIGARFLAAALQHIETDRDSSELKVLVATSGDTGGAVAAAFHGRPGISVYVLYPAGMVSPRQEKQLTCWGDNVHALRVAGVFDDCQSLVKQAFASDALRANQRLTSANSISIARLLPQTVYYAAASLWHWREYGTAASFIVPTGNLGNAVAGIWARHMGLPIGKIVLATNANRSIPDYLENGQWEPRQSLATLASAMDVGNPSNMERLRHLYADFDELNSRIDAYAVSDQQITRQIVHDYQSHQQLWCPHTATAAFVFDNYIEQKKTEPGHIVVATAHPAKFETVIEPMIDDVIEVPPALGKLLSLPGSYRDMTTDFVQFEQVLRS
ncbi:MAG: threonine synthase [Gammaproteobacteria bacterium]|nr:threonine synthase [Gammaproteobacteria bacterium]